jgi:hypothetical protein
MKVSLAIVPDGNPSRNLQDQKGCYTLSAAPYHDVIDFGIIMKRNPEDFIIPLVFYVKRWS